MKCVLKNLLMVRDAKNLRRRIAVRCDGLPKCTHTLPVGYLVDLSNCYYLTIINAPNPGPFRTLPWPYQPVLKCHCFSSVPSGLNVRRKFTVAPLQCSSGSSQQLYVGMWVTLKNSGSSLIFLVNVEF